MYSGTTNVQIFVLCKIRHRFRAGLPRPNQRNHQNFYLQKGRYFAACDTCLPCIPEHFFFGRFASLRGSVRVRCGCRDCEQPCRAFHKTQTNPHKPFHFICASSLPSMTMRSPVHTSKLETGEERRVKIIRHIDQTVPRRFSGFFSFRESVQIFFLRC